MKFSTIFSVYNPSKKAHPHHKIRAFQDAERHEFWECHILWHFEPEKHQKSDPERHKFQERHDSSAPWARETPKISPRKTQILGTP